MMQFVRFSFTRTRTTTRVFNSPEDESPHHNISHIKKLKQIIMKQLKFSFLIISLIMILSNIGWGQWIINSTTQQTQNFDGMGTSVTAYLPSGFRVNSTATYSSGTTATTLAYGTTGTGVVTGSSTGGTINWANGVTASATDRALGILNTGSYTSPRTIMVQIQNTTGSTISSIDIIFDYEKYRSGSRAFNWTFFHGSDGLAWTANTSGDQSYAADENNTVVFNPPTTTATKTFTISGLNIENNGFYYFAWTYTGVGGSSNGQGTAIDNLKLTLNSGVVSPPTTQASNITFSSVQSSQMTVNWTSGNGAKRIVKMNTLNSFTNPGDGTDPTANTVYSGSGEQVVYNNNSNTVTVTGLNANTTYWYRVYEYNGSGTGTKYLTSEATNNPNSQATSSAGTPTITVTSSMTDFGSVAVNTNSSVQQYTVSGTNLTDNIIITAPTGFQISTTNSPFTSSSPITLTQTGGTVNSITIYVRFSPTAIQTYSSSITHTSTGANNPSLTVTGIGTAPSDPASFTATVSSSTQINLAATGNSNGNNIIVVYNNSGTFTIPTNGTAPGNVGESFAGGTILYEGAAASIGNHSGLTPGTTYYYKAFSYDASNFYSTGSIANATTLKLAPTTQASDIIFSTVGNTSMTISWTNGNGEKRVVIMNTSNSFTNPQDGGTIPSTSTVYAGSGEQYIYNSTSNTVSVTGLTAGTVYWFRVYEYNNTSTNTLFNTSIATNNPNSKITNTPTSFIEDFEIGTKTAYATGSVTCTMGSWTMDDALIGTSASDRKNGSQSVRLRNGSIYMNFDVNNGARDVTIYHGKYGSDENKTWKLQKSTDGGSSWVDVGTEVTTSSTTLTAQTFNINQSGNVRFKILNTSSTTGIRVNIDDITITDYDKTVTTSSILTDTEYGNLTINGSGISVSLSNNTTVNGILTLTAGKILLGSNNLTLNTITGSNASNYIVTNGTGALIISNIGNSETLFPIGTADAYSPAWITNSGTAGDYTINVVSDPTGTNNGADRVKLKWDVNGPASSNTKLRIGWLTSQEGTNFTQNRSTYANLWHLYSGNWVTAGSATLASGLGGEFVDFTLFATGITVFSPFGTGLNESSMPVTLASLTSNVSGRNIVLNWSTSSEINNAGFDVERKSATGDWQKTGYVKGNGTTNENKTYSYKDMNLQTGKYYYRLKQIDYNGNFEYHNLTDMIEVGVPDKFALSQNYPNPFNPVTKINFDLPKDSKVDMRIYDMLGREVALLLNEVKTAGYYTINFNASRLSSGIYFYRLSTGDFTSVKKLVVIK